MFGLKTSDDEDGCLLSCWPCSLVEDYQRFSGPYYLHRKDDMYNVLHLLKTMTKQTARTSQKSVNLYQSTRGNNPEESYIHTHRRVNLNLTNMTIIERLRFSK